MAYWFHFWYVGDLNKTDATVPSMYHPAPTLLTLDPSLPPNLASELTELADQNPKSRYWKLRNVAEPCAQFPEWIEDIRAVKIKLTEDKVRRGRSVTSSVNPIDVRCEVSSEERERYITTLPLVMIPMHVNELEPNSMRHQSKVLKAKVSESESEWG